MRPSHRGSWRCCAGGVALLFALLLPTVSGAEGKPRRASLGYFGESAIHPGARAGFEGSFLWRPPHELMFIANIGGYGVPGDYYALEIDIGGAYRVTVRGGVYFDMRLALGYMTTSSLGGAQIMTADGRYMDAPTKVASYLMPIGSAGIGYDFLPLLRKPVGLYVRGTGLARYNSTDGLIGGVALEAGLTYQFGVNVASSPVLIAPPPSAPPAPGVAEPAPPLGTPSGPPPPSTAPSSQPPPQPTPPPSPPPP